MSEGDHQVTSIRVGEHEVTITHPGKIYFPGSGFTKLDLVRYYVAVSDGALRGVKGRPMVLKRYVNGADAPPFFQKRAPKKLPPFLKTVTLSFPSGRTANELVVNHPAGLVWVANLGCLDLNPHPTRESDLDHPDELRVDLDPVPGVEWKQIVEVAKVVRSTLEDFGLLGFIKTSGSRGIHVYVRILAKWGFKDVRRAAVALAREVEHRAPGIATAKWWKEERHGVFIDFNQNAKDRTVASAYSVRPLRDARVSMPIAWADLDSCNPGDFTLATVPALFAKGGDAHAAIDDVSGSLEKLLELADRQEFEGSADAPWPPHYPKQPGEAMRVAPSRAKKKGVTKTAIRRAKHPLIVIARSEDKEAALAGLERWKARHPKVVELLAPEDYLVDAMRGRSTTWTRIRVNLGKIPDDLRPPDELPDPDNPPTAMWGKPKLS